MHSDLDIGLLGAFWTNDHIIQNVVWLAVMVGLSNLYRLQRVSHLNFILNYLLHQGYAVISFQILIKFTLLWLYQNLYEFGASRTGFFPPQFLKILLYYHRDNKWKNISLNSSLLD